MDGELSDKSNIRKWISEFCIDDSNRAALCFREALIIALKGDSAIDVVPVGGYCIQIESIGPDGREFLVHVYSSMTVDGYFSGTKLTSSITEKLECLEEKHTEFLYKEDGLHEKSLFIGLVEDAYHVEIARTCPCNVSPFTETKNLKLCQYEDFIGEGANVLLMRYLAITNYEGALHFQNITIDGGIANNDYTCIALRDVELYGRHQKAYTIERRIHKENNITQRVRTYLTSRGQILVHDWLDIPYVVQKNPLLIQEGTNETVNIQVPLRERWMQDIEMLSKYLDMKSCNVAQYTNYLADHPEIKHLIADYVQTLLVGNQSTHRMSNFVPNLLRQPVDVIDFTIQHFKAFTREPKIWDIDMFSKQSDIDINSQLFENRSDIACSVCDICVKCRIASQLDKSLLE